MAVVKVSYTKEPAAAKATIRYIAHRPGKEHGRINRELWTGDGKLTRQEAYQLIDQAPASSTFFRLVLSPDPRLEDRERELSLRRLTAAVMGQLEERRGTPIDWLATLHEDHTAHRHVHALAIVQGRLSREDLHSLRERATKACREQQIERNLVKEAQRRREEERQWDVGYFS